MVGGCGGVGGYWGGVISPSEPYTTATPGVKSIWRRRRADEMNGAGVRTLVSSGRLHNQESVFSPAQPITPQREEETSDLWRDHKPQDRR